MTIAAIGSAPAPASSTGTVLVLFAHSTRHLSRVNRRLADAARQLDHVDLHDLYESYPDFYIDVPAEQARVELAQALVFLHPFQWYSMPALMKEWVDAVLLPGWAYGKGGHALAGKTYLLAVTTGSPAQYYSQGEVHARAFEDYLAPFRQTAELCGMRWAEPHVLHGAHTVDEACVERHVDAFVQRLAELTHAPRLV